MRRRPVLCSARERRWWSAKPPARRLAESIGLVALGVVIIALAVTGTLFDDGDTKSLLALVLSPVLIVVFAVRGVRAAGVRALRWVFLAVALGLLMPSAALAGWSAPTTVSEPGLDAFDPAVAVNARGDAAIAWHWRIDPYRSNVQVVTRSAGGSFGAPQTISTSTDADGNNVQNAEPDVAIDAEGNVMVVWRKTARRGPYTVASSTEAAFKPAGGAFRAPATLDVHDGSTGGAHPFVGFDARGNAVALWSEVDPYVHVARRPAGGSWSAAAAIPNPGSGIARVAFAASANGDGLAAWMTNLRVFAATLRPGEAPSVQELSASDPVNLTAAMDYAGNAAVGWLDWTDTDTEHRAFQRLVHRPAGGMFGATETIAEVRRCCAGSPAGALHAGLTAVAWPDATLSDSFNAAAFRTADGSYLPRESYTSSVVLDLRLAFDGDGALIAAWRRYDDRATQQGRAMAAVRPAGGQFSGQAETLSAIDSNVWPGDLAAAGNGRALAVWPRGGHPFHIEVAERQPAAAPQPAPSDPEPPAEEEPAPAEPQPQPSANSDTSTSTTDSSDSQQTSPQSTTAPAPSPQPAPSASTAAAGSGGDPAPRRDLTAGAARVSAYGGVRAWSAPAADGRWQLVLARGDQARTADVRPRGVPFDVDLGPDGDGGVVAVYSRCDTEPEVLAATAPDPAWATGRGCDLYRLDIGSGRETKLGGASTGQASEFLPSIWKDDVAFARVYPRNTNGHSTFPYLYVRPLDGSKPSARQPGGSRGRTGLPGPTGLDLYGRRLGFAWAYLDEDGGIAEARIDELAGDHQVIDKTGFAKSRARFLGPTFSRGRLFYAMQRTLGQRSLTSRIERYRLSTAGRSHADVPAFLTSATRDEGTTILTRCQRPQADCAVATPSTSFSAPAR